jgi:6,7-dimethyl-8-ribityllumazine synthase
MKKILIVQARYYEDISDMLLEGTTKHLKENGFEYEIVTISGAFEIPAVIALASKSKENYQGYIALGCVIKGETTHYDYVCLESARGLNDLAYKDGLAIGYGIITCENKDQAIARADMKQKNKGGFAAKVCLEMIDLISQFKN